MVNCGIKLYRNYSAKIDPGIRFFNLESSDTPMTPRPEPASGTSDTICHTRKLVLSPRTFAVFLKLSATYLMVLLEFPDLTSAHGLRAGKGHRGVHIIALPNTNIIRDTLFNLCEVYEATVMSSIPFTAFSAGRIRETQQRDMKISNITKTKEASAKYFNTTFKEPSPLKYNSKLMNSIWGFYNRYSPHNVKKVNDANAFSGEMQQPAAISSTKTDSRITLPSSALDNVWAAINVSQSH